MVINSISLNILQVTVRGVDITSSSKVYFDFKISINEVIIRIKRDHLYKSIYKSIMPSNVHSHYVCYRDIIWNND